MPRGPMASVPRGAPEAGDAYGFDVGSSRDIEDFADALAAQLDMEIAAMDPANPGVARAGQAPQQAQGKSTAYDPWDDEALDQFLDDYDLDGVDPILIGQIQEQATGGEQTEETRNGRLRFLMVAGVALLFLAGAGYGAWSYLGPSVGLGGPQLVKAPEGPFKVKPDPNAKDVTATTDGEAIFDTVGGAKTPAKGEERLVTRNEQVPELPAVKPQVSRVTLPDGQQIEAELPSGFDPADTGPRRVRTVLVRPDGSLIENPNSAPGASTAQNTQQPQDGTGQLIAQAEAADDDSTLPPPMSANDQTTAPDVPAKSPITGKPIATQAQTTAAPGADASAPASAMPLPPSRPSTSATTHAAAPAAGDAPLDLAAAAQSSSKAPAKLAPAASDASTTASLAPASPAASSGGSGAYVQLSSQRSEDAALAAYKALQKKFPSVLGSMQPDVQKADLGAKGIYYRVRVGQPTRDQAAALCEQLRAAGGDCLLAK